MTLVHTFPAAASLLAPHAEALVGIVRTAEADVNQYPPELTRRWSKATRAKVMNDHMRGELAEYADSNGLHLHLHHGVPMIEVSGMALIRVKKLGKGKRTANTPTKAQVRLDAQRLFPIATVTPTLITVGPLYDSVGLVVERVLAVAWEHSTLLWSIDLEDLAASAAGPGTAVVPITPVKPGTPGVVITVKGGTAAAEERSGS